MTLYLDKKIIAKSGGHGIQMLLSLLYMPLVQQSVCHAIKTAAKGDQAIGVVTDILPGDMGQISRIHLEKGPGT